MIPRLNIIAWSKNAPWAELRQVEQDLIICRALVDLFSDPLLSKELRFRGGTAINKLLFPKPMRYSEDIDLVRTSAGRMRDVLGQIRDVLRPWLGEATYDRSAVAPKLRFRAPAEDGSADLRLKIEINTREVDALDPTNEIAFSVENPWFTGSTKIMIRAKSCSLRKFARCSSETRGGIYLTSLTRSKCIVISIGLARSSCSRPISRMAKLRSPERKPRSACSRSSPRQGLWRIFDLYCPPTKRKRSQTPQSAKRLRECSGA
jgi:hypothetical protein